MESLYNYLINNPKIEDEIYHCPEIILKQYGTMSHAIESRFCEYITNDLNLVEVNMFIIKVKGIFIKFIHCQTGNLCLDAVKENGYVLQYVKEQTNDICLEAVKQNGVALQFVKEQTEEICLEAVNQTGLALKYSKNQTLDICLIAVKQNRYALRYVDERFIDDVKKLIRTF